MRIQNNPPLHKRTHLRWVQIFKFIVSRQHNGHIGLFEGVLNAQQRKVLVLRHMGIKNGQLKTGMVLFQLINDGKRRRFANIIHIAFVRQPQQSDLGFFPLPDGIDDFLNHHLRHTVVDFTRHADQFGVRREFLDDKPRVHADAMTTHAGARRMNVHARVAVGHPNHFPDVDMELFANPRDLIGQGDVHVPVRVFQQFDHLSHRGFGEENFAGHKRFIQPLRFFRPERAHGADHSVVSDEFLQRLAWNHPLGAIRDAHVASDLEIFLFNHGDNKIPGRSGRRGGFQNHQIPLFDQGQNGFHGSGDIGHIGRWNRAGMMIVRGWYRDNEHIRFGRFGIDG